MDIKKLVIIDGNSLMNRAFYALPPMNNSKGNPTGAIYGFTMMLFKIIDEIKPDYIEAAFDRKAKTFRHKEYADYKAGRKKMPDELASQIQPIKEVLKAFNVGIDEIDGYEADDVIGTISKRYEADDLKVFIYTGDKDALQLISKNTNAMITKKGITEVDIFDEKALFEKYGLQPSGIIDLKGLMGDASDNLPGVSGIGEKTALKLLGEYKTLENVYENIEKITGKKIKESLICCKEDAFLSKRLATIDRNVPIEVDINKSKVTEYNPEKIKELFAEYEFNSLMGRIKTKEDNLIEMTIELKAFTEESIKDVKKNKILNFSIVNEEKGLKGIIIDGDYFIPSEKLDSLTDIFSDEGIIKNSYSCKPIYNYFKCKGIDIKGMEFDAEIAAYLLNPSESKYEMQTILQRYADFFVPQNIINDSAKLGAIFVDKVEIIKKNMMESIKNLGMMELYKNVEMPLIEVLSDMECAGFKIDKETLNNIGFELSEEIDKLTGEIYDLAGQEFNINSPKQLGVILFEKLNLPVIKKTKTGYSTDAEVLEELSTKHEIIEKILNYRQLTKLKSTYIDGLMSSIGKDDRIHSSFMQTVTATGRISSIEPNLQNIPIKIEQGKRIRKAFVPKDNDYVILSGDYSQIELRVLADISKDENLIDAFTKGQDIHTRTASEVFEIPMEDVTPIQRSRAKTVNFGIIYGLSDYGLSKDLKISRKEAKTYIDNYFDRYKGVKTYMENVIVEAKANGYVKTMMNRVRYIPEINASNKMVKNLGERLAMNTPIQGSAADIIKIAMIRVFKRIKSENLRSRLILQVHDELIIETHVAERDYIKKLLKEEMENAVKLAVPLVVDINCGNNWYETK